MENSYKKCRAFSAFEFVVAIGIILLIILVIIPAIEKTVQVAHEYSVRATAKAFEKSVMIAKQLYILEEKQGPINNLERYNDGNVDFNAAGFPIGAIMSEGGAEPSTDYACIDVWNAVLIEPRPQVSLDDTGEYKAIYQYFNRYGRCHYHYLPAGKMSITYEFATGKVYYDDDFL